LSEVDLNVNGKPINPTARAYPRDFIQTGISIIDGMNTLIRGQKLPLFSGNGLTHNELAAQIARQAKIRGTATQFAVVFAAKGVPDLTGYITEGQIVFEREMHARSIYPPVAGLPSLSRLMKDGIGEGMTRADHPHLASQLFAAYSYVKDVRNLASVIGEEELTPLDHQYLDFGEFFEHRFVAQRTDEDRTIEQTLDLGWECLRKLPREELHRVTEQELDKHYQASAGE
jgi:V/A-type H+-transporting ATPase subunit B